MENGPACPYESQRRWLLRRLPLSAACVARYVSPGPSGQETHRRGYPLPRESAASAASRLYDGLRHRSDTDPFEPVVLRRSLVPRLRDVSINRLCVSDNLLRRKRGALLMGARKSLAKLVST